MQKIMKILFEVMTKIGENEDEAQEYYDNCCFDWRDASENEIEDYEGEWLSI